MASVMSATDLRRLEGLDRTQQEIRLLLLAAEAKLAELQSFLSERGGVVFRESNERPVAWIRPDASCGDGDDVVKNSNQSTLTADGPARRAVAPAGGAASKSTARRSVQRPAHASVPAAVHRCGSLAERLKTYPRPLHPPHPVRFGAGVPHCALAFQRTPSTLSARQRRQQYLYGGSGAGGGAARLTTLQQSQVETTFSAGPSSPTAFASSQSARHSSMPDLSTASSCREAADADRADPAGIVRSQSDVDLWRDGDSPHGEQDGGGAERCVRRNTSFFHVSQDRDVVDAPTVDRGGDEVLGATSMPDRRGQAHRAGDSPVPDAVASDTLAGSAATSSSGDATKQGNVSTMMIPQSSHAQMDPSRTVRASIKRTSTIGSGLRQHTVYHCTASDRSGTVYEADRRYNDFVMLRNVIQWQYPSLKPLLPPLPEKKMLGKLHSNVVEQRRLGLQNFLQFIASHPELRHDEDLVLKPWLLRST